MTGEVWVGVVAVLVTFSTFLATVIFRMGGIHARIGALEEWRSNVRNDMHEISDKLGTIAAELQAVMTLIEERTDRRANHKSAFVAPDDDRRSRV